MDYPDKVSSLMILNSPHNRGEELQAQVELRAKKAKEQGSLATMDEALKRWFTADYLVNGEGAKHVTKWRQSTDDESYAQASWVLANGVRELIGSTTGISTRTLIMTCENDVGSTPKMSYDISNEITGSQVLIISNLKHLGLIEKPDAFTMPILNFLSGIKR